jgi:hypothetical protein
MTESKYVQVVTHVEMGWDCVCGVFETYEGALRHIYSEPEHANMSFQELADMFEDDDTCYIIHEKRMGS